MKGKDNTMPTYEMPKDYTSCPSMSLNRDMLATLEAVASNQTFMASLDIMFRAHIEDVIMLGQEAENKLPSIPDHYALDVEDSLRALISDCEQLENRSPSLTLHLQIAKTILKPNERN